MPIVAKLQSRCLNKKYRKIGFAFAHSPANFVNQYLHFDENNDYVINTLPYPFFGADNYCSVYENRPNACREYPYTDSRKMHTLFKETFNNIAICPAVFEILEKLKINLLINKKCALRCRWYFASVEFTKPLIPIGCNPTVNTIAYKRGNNDE